MRDHEDPGVVGAGMAISAEESKSSAGRRVQSAGGTGRGTGHEDVSVKEGVSSDEDAAATLPRPIVKWAGGKTRLLPELVKRVPREFGDYHEPFAGGLAFFFRLWNSRLGDDASRPDRLAVRRQVFLSDLNADLIHMYRAVADRPLDVSAEIRTSRAAHGESYYYMSRRGWNDSAERQTWSDAQRAACFLYLNRAGYNGLWRVNARGAFNVPLGRSSSGGPPSLPSEEDLECASWALQDAHLSCMGFRLAVGMANPGDFVYLDPPYVPIGKSRNFSTYTAGGFTHEDHVDLARCFRELADRGVKVMLSNSDTPIVRELYQGFRVEVVFAPRSINASGAGRGKIGELLITSGCP